MDRLVAKVARILRQSFPGAEVELQRKDAESKLSGDLIWRGFSGKDQLSRQRKLWKALHEHLSAEDEAKVSLILTLTPRELAVIQEG